jgi:hypothetical protein
LDENNPHAINPVTKALLPQLPDPEARAISMADVDTILAAMPEVGQGLAGKARDSASKNEGKARRHCGDRPSSQPAQATDAGLGEPADGPRDHPPTSQGQGRQDARPAADGRGDCRL